ncbi:hypothetical protein SLA2020_403880 [Shorea laevis]
MEGKRTLTMNWDGLRDDDDDDRFFESNDRVSSAVSLDLASSSSDEDDDNVDFEESRVSFTSAVSSVRSAKSRSSSAKPPDYDFWISTPGSINERRKRLLRGMGLDNKKDLISFKRNVSNKSSSPQLTSTATISPSEEPKTESPSNSNKTESPSLSNSNSNSPSPSQFPIVLVRSRSDSDIETFSISRRRKLELIGAISKQRLTRTYSMILAPRARVFPPYVDSLRVWPKEAGSAAAARRSIRGALSKSRFGAFFLIKNLDTGTEFIVSEYSEDGMWNRPQRPSDREEANVGGIRQVRRIFSGGEGANASRERVVEADERRRRRRHREESHREFVFLQESKDEQERRGCAVEEREGFCEFDERGADW